MEDDSPTSRQFPPADDDAAPARPRRRRTIELSEPAPDPDPALAPLRHEAAACQRCPLHRDATQTVFGEGSRGAVLMLVGEQPGDAEDRAGRPFVGPAGRLLARALGDLGWPRSSLYLTNAVKHFKFEWRGKRRLHKTPGQLEALACLHWLESEVEAVQPGAIVALGAVAARSLLGRSIPVAQRRGQWERRAGDGRPVLIAFHPSALLRLPRDDFDAAYAAWLEDLRAAALPPGR